ncbi:MAG: hypothetical protein GEV07_29065 [Streptosporangiales bacterium]|nr:hypothetical protein [Streptosporangiales bacterium]
MMRVREGTELEVLAGYNRAVRLGQIIAVSGTTANGPDGRVLHLGDTAGQARACLSRAIECVEELGGSRESIVRTRMLLTPEADWRAASEAHAALLGDVAPANITYMVHALVGAGFLLEVEVDAVVEQRPDSSEAPE